MWWTVPLEARLALCFDGSILGYRDGLCLDGVVLSFVVSRGRLEWTCGAFSVRLPAAIFEG